MANAEWERLRESLKEAPTEEARKRAAEAMRRYLATHPTKKSRPTLVSLKYKAPYPTAIEIKDIPLEIERNPEFYNLLSRVIGKTK